jgi:hypothetical protein
MQRAQRIDAQAMGGLFRIVMAGRDMGRHMDQRRAARQARPRIIRRAQIEGPPLVLRIAGLGTAPREMADAIALAAQRIGKVTADKA